MLRDLRPDYSHLETVWHGGWHLLAEPPDPPSLPDNRGEIPPSRPVDPRSIRDRVLAALDRPLNTQEMAERSGLTHRQVQSAIWDLTFRGVVIGLPRRRGQAHWSRYVRAGVDTSGPFCSRKEQD